MSFWSRLGDALKVVGDSIQNGAGLLTGNTDGLTGGSAAAAGTASFGDEIRGVYADTVSKHGLLDDREAQQWHVAGHLSQNYDLSSPGGIINATENTAGGIFKPAAENSVTGPVLQKMGEAFQKADQGVGAAALYDSAAAELGLAGPLRDNAKVWARAWEMADRSKGLGPNGAALLFESQSGNFDGANNPLTNKRAAEDVKDKYTNSWWGIGAGVADTIMLGAVDPTKGIGRVAKGARMANKLSSVGKADEVAAKLNSAATAADATAGVGRKLTDTALGTFGKSASVEGNTSALYKAMTQTHGYDAITLRDHYAGLLEHTGQANSMPILDLMSRAGRIADPHEQAIVKGNILLAARGSATARAELIASAPKLAAGLQRVTAAPTYFAHLDDLATKVASRPGYNLAAVRQAAERLDNTPENKAELLAYVGDLDKVQAHFDKLDSFSGIGANAAAAQNAVEIGMTALDRAKASMRKSTSFVFQDGTSGATTTVLRWSTRDRNMGFVNVAEPMVGVDHLTSALKDTKLYTPQEIRDRANKFIGAGTQQGRKHVAEGVLDGMITKLGAKYHLSRSEVDAITADLQATRVQATEYLSSAAANAAKDARTITFSDPGYTSKIAVDRALLETHMRDAVVIPPVDMLEEAIKHYKHDWSLGDRIAKGSAQADAKLESMTRLWRFMVLARPGLAVRAMADTGLRAAALAGAANMFLNTVNGVTEQGRRLGKNAPRRVELDAAGQLRVQQMTREAAALRTQADGVADPTHLYRAEEAGTGHETALPADKPHGLYMTPVKDATTKNAFAGDFDRWGVKYADRRHTASVPLDHPSILPVKNFEMELKGLRGNSSVVTEADAGVAALRHLLGQDKFDAIIAEGRKGKKHFAEYMAKEHPGVDWTKYHDPYEMLMGYGGLEARKAGYKGLLGKGVEDGTHEFVALTNDVLDGKHTRFTREELRARADKLESQAQAMQFQGMSFRGDRRSAAKGVTVTLAGKKHNLRAHADEGNLRAIEHAVLPGGHQLHEGIVPVVRARYDKLTENADQWTTAMPDDPYWAERYTRSMDALRTSYTGKRVLSEADQPEAHDLLKSLRNDARVRAEWQTVKEAHPSLNAWIEDMVNLAEFHAPTAEVRAALLGERVTVDQLNALFKDATGKGDGLDRMPVNAPQFSHMLEKDADGFKNARDSIFRLLLDKPDVHLIRMPLYKSQFAEHARAQVAAMGREGVKELNAEDLARIESNARHRAIQDVRRTMFNTMRHTGAQESMRVIAPFMSPWQDAMESWARLMYDDPQVAGKWLRYWQLPAQAGLVVDQDGQIIQPWEDTASAGKTKMINIPLPQGVKNLTGLTDVRIRQDSLNSAFQGEVPWMPGFGPAVAVPAQQLIGHLMPELGDSKNPVLRSLFPFGLPEGSNRIGAAPTQLAGQFVPSWVRSVYNGMNQNSAEFGRGYATALYGNIAAFTEKNGRKPTSDELAPLQAQAKGAVRTAMVLKGAVLGMFGISTTNSVRGQFYVEQMHQLYQVEPQLQAKGYTVTEVFNKFFPEAADLKWTATENKTGIQYTMQAENAARRYKTQIDKNPEYGWFYAGTENMGGEYSPTANALQKGELYGPGGLHRRVLSPMEQDQRVEMELGWAEYRKFATAAQVELEKRGLHSFSQKGATDLQALRQDLREKLFVKYPEFQRDYTSNAGTAIQRFEPVLSTALADPKLKNRSDVQAIAKYMSIREQTIELLKNNKGRSADLKDWRNADATEYLRQQGEQLSRDNLGFQQAWQRLFSREVDN